MMRGGRIPLLLFLVLPAASAQTKPDELLKQIRARVSDSLARLPNYICRQTVERYVRVPDSKRYRLQDTLRLDVALIGGRELYAWPGSSKFEEKGLEEVVGGGATGTGNFAIHIRNLFLKPGAVFKYIGEQETGGRRGHRFDFRIPRAQSEFYLREGKEGAFVGYYGSFWANPDTFDLLRLEVLADDIPAPLTFTKSLDYMDYAQVRIGEREFTLLKTSEMQLLSPIGDSRNVTRFEGCKQYSGESVVSFGDPMPAAEGAKPVQAVQLPAGLDLEMSLAVPIDPGKTAVGDPVSAILAKDVKRDGKVLLPKGAVFSGRMTRLEHRKDRALAYMVVGLLLDSVEAPGLRGEFHGTLEDAGININGAFHVPFHDNPGATFNIWTNYRHRIDPPRPDEGVFYVRGDNRRVSKGTRMLWRTAKQ